MTHLPASDDALFSLIGHTFDGIALWDPAPCRVVYANPAFWQLLDAPTGDTTSQEPLEWMEPASRAELMGLIDRLGRGDSTHDMLTARVAPHGGRTAIEVRLCRLVHGEKPLVGMIIAGSAGSPAQGSYVADRRDPLTSLPDREFLMQRLAVLLRGDRIVDRHFAVLFLDLDNFKQVNDEFGHLLGDNVLREAARRIATCVREGDHVVRFGGDEFVILVEGIAGANEVEPVINRIRNALARPIALPGGEVTLSLSVGMAAASGQHGSPEELLDAADQAMYAAKRNL